MARWMSRCAPRATGGGNIVRHHSGNARPPMIPTTLTAYQRYSVQYDTVNKLAYDLSQPRRRRPFLGLMAVAVEMHEDAEQNHVPWPSLRAWDHPRTCWRSHQHRGGFGTREDLDRVTSATLFGQGRVHARRAPHATPRRGPPTRSLRVRQRRPRTALSRSVAHFEVPLSLRHSTIFVCHDAWVTPLAPGR